MTTGLLEKDSESTEARVIISRSEAMRMVAELVGIRRAALNAVNDNQRVAQRAEALIKILELIVY